MMGRILVIGATGQIGSALVPALRARYGSDRVVAAGHTRKVADPDADAGPSISLDVRDRDAVEKAVGEHGITIIYHLAAVLSADAEADPQRAWDVNMTGLINVLEVARHRGCAVFFPSSIGVFGPLTPSDPAPQDTIQRPGTMYGITKVAGELLCDYYYRHYGVDTRGIRFPGLVSYETPPSGGTTDYAVEMFLAAAGGSPYACFLRGDTRLDLMYMPDAVRAAVELMEADLGGLRHRNAFNVAAMTVSPEDLAAEIRRHLPGFTVTYGVDPVRQAIADSWPKHMDDRAAREEWGWSPAFDLAAMTADMLQHLAGRPEGLR